MEVKETVFSKTEDLKLLTAEETFSPNVSTLNMFRTSVTT
jgi:hypothetical protein